jgi:ribose-phosphate pyrophosphokinase
VVDDICDGGGTFALLRDAMPPEVSLDLWVTHGGFTGPEHSRQALAGYHRVHTTDSLPNTRNRHVRVTNLAPYVTRALRRIATKPEGTQP